MADARIRTVVSIVKENVAKEMSKQTQYTVTRDMVTWVKAKEGNGVFVAHVDNVTLLCKIYGVGNYCVKTISW